MDISNNQRQLFGAITRSYLRDGVSGKPVEDGVMIMNYTDRIQEGSYANYPYEVCNQLDAGTHIGTFGKKNSQPSYLPNPIIYCVPRKNETASRFNYAIDRSVDRRMVDVSGISIPNNMLRVMPNRGIQLCYQDRIIPANAEILKLSQRIGNISSSQLDKTFNISESDLRFKIKNQKLTREELMELGKGGTITSDRGILAIPNTVQQMRNNPIVSSSRSSSSVGTDENIVNIENYLSDMDFDTDSTSLGKRGKKVSQRKLSQAVTSRKRNVRGAGRPPLTREKKRRDYVEV